MNHHVLVTAFFAMYLQVEKERLFSNILEEENISFLEFSLFVRWYEPMYSSCLKEKHLCGLSS